MSHQPTLQHNQGFKSPKTNQPSSITKDSNPQNEMEGLNVPRLWLRLSSESLRAQGGPVVHAFVLFGGEGVEMGKPGLNHPAYSRDAV